MKTIEIIVTPAGETKLETNGFNGSECQAATRLLEQSLGVITSDQQTAEFYVAHQQQTRLNEGH